MSRKGYTNKECPGCKGTNERRTDSIMNVGKSIRCFRRMQGMRQIKLCKKVGISQTYMSQVETQNRNLTWKKLCKVADAIEVPVPIILHFAQNKSELSTKALVAYEILDPVMKQIVGAILAENLSI